MRYGMSGAERRRRRRRWALAAKTGLFLGLFGGVGVFGYQMGVEQLKAREALLEAELTELQTAKAALEATVSKLQTDVAVAKLRARDFEERYAAEAPQGEARRLLDLAKERLAAGISAERLAFVISSASEPRDCGKPEIKRFIVLTPLYKGANSSVGFAEGRITITADGPSAKNEQGDAEAWFDAAQPITVRFTVIGGDQSKTTGQLPLHHAVMLNDGEYRFSVVEEQRGFVQITAQRCAAP